VYFSVSSHRGRINEPGVEPPPEVIFPLKVPLDFSKYLQL
jgi:hypothetical protein